MHRMESSLPAFVSWRILDLATVSTGGGHSDPFTRLGLDPTTLPNGAYVVTITANASGGGISFVETSVIWGRGLLA